MAIIECGNGHIYDTNQYASCPYCESNNPVINFNSPDYNERTVAPESMMGNAYQNIEDMGKTVAPASFKERMEGEGKTVAVFQEKHNLDPIVGWLVCVEGDEKGKDYHLFAKINTIGRNEKNDVQIKDVTISKDSHARLAYDPKHNNFQLIPGNNINNIYLNDEPVYTPVKINAYDVIEFGSSKTVFIPLCCEKFDWENGLKKD